MEILPNAALPAASSAQKPEPASKNDAVLSSDFETFLKMLTAQARYQDPLEPLDSTEYAAQLAQFSMVEQQVKTNENLEAISGTGNTSSMAGLASWVGMEIATTGPMRFDGTALNVSPEVASGADKAELVVTNSRGQEVDRRAFPVSSSSLAWNGETANGTVLTGEDLTFSVESYRQGSVTSTAPASVYAKVVEAQRGQTEPALVLQNGSKLNLSEVTAIREARS